MNEEEIEEFSKTVSTLYEMSLLLFGETYYE